jgi:hypothetical protein
LLCGTHRNGFPKATPHSNTPDAKKLKSIQIMKVFIQLSYLGDLLVLPDFVFGGSITHTAPEYETVQDFASHPKMNLLPVRDISLFLKPLNVKKLKSIQIWKFL